MSYFVNGLAEVLFVVRADARVVLRLLRVLLDLQLTRGRGEPDLNGVPVALQHFVPLAPCGAMALVDDDMAEAVRRIVLQQEGGIVA